MYHHRKSRLVGNFDHHADFLRLKARYPGTCVVILYHLEAAIQGVDIKALDGGCKTSLKAWFQQVQAPARP